MTRRKKGEITKLKEKLWQLCRTIQFAKYGRVCYTCGKTIEQSRACHLGHFIPSALCSPPLRYDLGNLRPQCYNCNINLSGNWPAYEEELMREMGPTHTKDLKRRNKETGEIIYGKEWYEEKIAEYQKIAEAYE